MRFEIDCESKEHVFQSLSNGFSCSIDDLENILLDIDIEKIYADNWENIDIPSDQYLYQYTVNTFGNHKTLGKVNWFHLTRTTKQNEFKDGILPLGESLQSIWTTLIDIPTDAEIINNLKLLKENGVPNYHYNLKHNNRFHSGPYAVLVKDTAFTPESLCQHDYLGMPEIIEDICDGYNIKYGESIIEIIKSFLVPKIVKFQSSMCVDTGCIEAALFYAYELARGNPPSRNCVTCFDGKNAKINPESIIYVTTIEN